MDLSWTTWLRLEPSPRGAKIEPGLEAAIHDPLWMLARQWQLGEFQGEDVGSPIEAQLQMTCTPITRYLPGSLTADRSSQAVALGRNMPLEVVIERESVRKNGATQLRLAAESGLQFLRLLSLNGAESARAFVVREFPLAVPNGGELSPLDTDTRRFLSVTSGRLPDGWLLHAILRGGQGIAAGDIRADQARSGIQKWNAWQQAQTNEVQKAVKAWLDWYEKNLFVEPPEEVNPAWLHERMEYAAAVAAPIPEYAGTPGSLKRDATEVVLVAPEYTDGFLDWYSFDMQSRIPLGAERTDLTAKEQDLEQVKASAIPVPITFRGMPASRYWEFEDARVDFGGINAGPQQLAMLLLVEFGLIAGDDWYVIPVVAPVGTLCRTDWLVVRDTFGDWTWVESTRIVDRKNPSNSTAPELSWDMWRLLAKARTDEALSDVLFLPPTLEGSLQGKPIEEVLFLRDEMANMAWAVERIVEGALGQPVNRSEAYFRTRPPRTVPVVSTNGARQDAPQLKYRLYTDVPPHWVPLRPERQNANGPEVLLRRDSHAKDSVQGYILEPRLEAMNLHEEEVPREGARVTRAFQLARWAGGETYLWIGRRKEVGRGEGSSGLQFDVLVPTERTDS